MPHRCPECGCPAIEFPEDDVAVCTHEECGHVFWIEKEGDA